MVLLGVLQELAGSLAVEGLQNAAEVWEFSAFDRGSLLGCWRLLGWALGMFWSSDGRSLGALLLLREPLLLLLLLGPGHGSLEGPGGAMMEGRRAG